VVAIYAERLRLRGHAVAVVSLPLRVPSWSRKVKSALLGRRIPKGPVPEPSYFAGLDVVHHVLERWRPVGNADVPDGDVVVATWWETAEWVRRLSSAKGAKTYFIQNYEAHHGMPKERVDATWRMPLHKIVISQWLLGLARDHFGDAFASHVPNSVDTKQFWAPPRGKQARPTIGLLYSAVECKGVDVSLAAVSMVRKKLLNAGLVTFGAQHVTPSLALPGDSEFHFQPPQSQISDLYAKCDVWLCGSRIEGFHLPPLEAMACRCPVVSTRVGGPMDIVEDGVNGYLLDVDDINGLADRLERVLSMSAEDWRKMSDAACATAHRYTWDDATEAFEQALRLAIERNQRGQLGAMSADRKGVSA
jgi:glycosyltransferase involved in cell wall biosynthesis